MTRPICWKKTIGNSRRAVRSMYGVRAVATDALISGNGFGSLRRSYESLTTDRSRVGIRDYGHSSAPVGPTLAMAGSPEPAACVAWVQNFPTRLRRRTIACRRRVAFRQHLLEKLMSLQFAPLCGHVLIRKISPSRAWLCSMAQAGPLEATGS